jgi:peptide/nickel transport system substrate-binding protein
VGIRAQLNLMPNAQFTQKIRRLESSLYVLSWGVPTFDASYTLRAIMASRSMGGSASWNLGGWSNPAFDAMVARMDNELDPAARRGIMQAMHRLHNADMGHLPLYHMMIPWAHRQGVAITHRADNQFSVREIRVEAP